MAGLPATTQHEAEGLSRGHASGLWRSRYFSIPWPTCGGVGGDSGSSSAPELDKRCWENSGEETGSPQTRSPSRTPVDLALQRTPTVQSRSSGSNHVSVEPPSHPMMVVIRMEPEPEPIRIRGGGCCGGGTGGGGGSRVRVDPSPHTKGKGVPAPTEKPNIHRAPTPAGNDKPGSPTQCKQPANATKPADATKPTKSTNPASSTKTAKSTKPADPTKSTKSAKPTKPIQPTQPTPKAASARASESKPITQPTGSARTTQPAQPDLTVNSSPSIQPTQAAEPVRPTPTSQTAPTASSIQPTQMTYSTQPTQSGQLMLPPQLTHTAITGDSSPGDSSRPSQASPLPPRQSGAAPEEVQKTGLGLTGPQPQQESATTAEGVSVSRQPNQQSTPAGATSRTVDPIARVPPDAEAHRLSPPQPEPTSMPARKGSPQPVPNPSIPVPTSSSRRRK